MHTKKQILASRANGAKSKGPKTAEGKRRSAFNATRHGLLSRVCVLKGEDAEAFSALCRQHIEKLQPRDQAELTCVEEMTSAAWRLRRYAAIESELTDMATDERPDPRYLASLTKSFSHLAYGPELKLLARFEVRLSRLYQRSFENLMMLRQFESNSEAEDPDVTEPDENDPDPAQNDEELSNDEGNNEAANNKAANGQQTTNPEPIAPEPPQHAPDADLKATRESASEEVAPEAAPATTPTSIDPPVESTPTTASPKPEITENTKTSNEPGSAQPPIESAAYLVPDSSPHPPATPETNVVF